MYTHINTSEVFSLIMHLPPKYNNSLLHILLYVPFIIQCPEGHNTECIYGLGNLDSYCTVPTQTLYIMSFYFEVKLPCGSMVSRASRLLSPWALHEISVGYKSLSLYRTLMGAHTDCMLEHRW